MTLETIYPGYGAAAIEHARAPRNCGRMESCDGHARITGPCGDTMEFWIKVLGDRLADVTFTTDGCVSSHAAGSMTTVLAMRKTVRGAMELQQHDVLAALGGMPEEVEHCALLSTNTLRAACEDFLQRCKDSPFMPEDLIEACQVCEKKECSALVQRDGESDDDWRERQQLTSRVCRIKRKILVLSGKGGVGKSTVAANLAAALTLAGQRVGLLDVDIHGPTIPQMFCLNDSDVAVENDSIVPPEVGSLKIMSVAFMLKQQDEPVIWRGPMKMGAIRQFVRDVQWGELDYLIVDAPPGTGDEQLSTAQILADADGAVIVTTPQQVAVNAVRKCVRFCEQLQLPVLGVVENMHGYVCPKCGERSDLFGSNGGLTMAGSMGVSYLGSLPLDPAIMQAGEDGRPYINQFKDSATGQEFSKIAKELQNRFETEGK